MHINTTIDSYIRSGKESETLLINQLSLLRASNNEEVYKFGFGQSPFPIPIKITQALADAAHHKEYMSVQGHLPLRRAIANFHNNIEGRNFHADNIIIGAGSKILIFSIMAAFAKAEVVLAAPSWVSYEPQAKLVGHRQDWIPTTFDENWSLTPELLDTYCLNRKNPNVPLILVLNYPNNPTGQTFSAQQLQKLATVMQKHKIITIADEIYSLLSFKGKQTSIADFYPEGCIVTSGLSKWCGAGGWRLGFMHVPSALGKKLFQAIIAVASETYSCAPAPIQIAATTAYQEQHLATEFLQKQTSVLALINRNCTIALNHNNIKVHACSGGFYLFPDFSYYKLQLKKQGITTSNQLISKIMNETGVVLLPGSAFGMPKQSLTARLAFVDFDGSQILYKPVEQVNINKIITGINKLCKWFKNF